jgi:sulfur carrier protein ThiS
MEVTVKLFGNLGHYLPDGANRFSFAQPLEDGATVHDMVKALKIPEEAALIAIVNGVRVDRDHVLRHGDEANLFRPSGGG